MLQGLNEELAARDRALRRAAQERSQREEALAQVHTSTCFCGYLGRQHSVPSMPCHAVQFPFRHLSSLMHRALHVIGKYVIGKCMIVSHGATLLMCATPALQLRRDLEDQEAATQDALRRAVAEEVKREDMARRLRAEQVQAGAASGIFASCACVWMHG